MNKHRDSFYSSLKKTTFEEAWDYFKDIIQPKNKKKKEKRMSNKHNVKYAIIDPDNGALMVFRSITGLGTFIRENGPALTTSVILDNEDYKDTKQAFREGNILAVELDLADYEEQFDEVLNG